MTEGESGKVGQNKRQEAGRKEGRKGGREEGRKEGRKEGSKRVIRVRIEKILGKISGIARINDEKELGEEEIKEDAAFHELHGLIGAKGPVCETLDDGTRSTFRGLEL